MQIEQCIHFTNALWSLTAFAFCLVHVRLYISMLYFVVWTPAEKIYGRNSSDGVIVSDWLTIIILTLGFCSFLQRIRWSLSGSDLTSTPNNRKSRRTTCVATCHSRGGSIRSVSSMQCRGKIQMETGSLMPTWVPSCDRFMVTVKARSKAFINKHLDLSIITTRLGMRWCRYASKRCDIYQSFEVATLMLKVSSLKRLRILINYYTNCVFVDWLL